MLGSSLGSTRSRKIGPEQLDSAHTDNSYSPFGILSTDCQLPYERDLLKLQRSRGWRVSAVKFGKMISLQAAACSVAVVAIVTSFHATSAATLLPKTISINATSYSEQITLSAVSVCATHALLQLMPDVSFHLLTLDCLAYLSLLVQGRLRRASPLPQAELQPSFIASCLQYCEWQPQHFAILLKCYK